MSFVPRLRVGLPQKKSAPNSPQGCDHCTCSIWVVAFQHHYRVVNESSAMMPSIKSRNL